MRNRGAGLFVANDSAKSRAAAPRPWPVAPHASNYARRVWWRGFELTPGVMLRASARLRPELAAMAERPRDLLPALVQAASGALSLHPRINFYVFWGRLVHAGGSARVGVVLENPDGSCTVVGVENAHRLSRAEVDRALAAGRLPAAPGPWERLRERTPVACYLAERLTGVFARRYRREVPPLFLSQLGLAGIEELAFTPAHSMALYPGWPREGRLPLTLCFSHALANARPVARFLLTICDLLG